MLIKYDAKSGVWIASALIDGHPAVVMSRDMKRAMQLMGRLLSAEPVVLDHVPVPARPITIQ